MAAFARRLRRVGGRRLARGRRPATSRCRSRRARRRRRVDRDVLLVGMAVFAPLLVEPNSPDPYQMPRDWSNVNAPPGTPGHPLGTTPDGGDVLYGIVWGADVAAARLHRRVDHDGRRHRDRKPRGVPRRPLGRHPDAGGRRLPRGPRADPRARDRGRARPVVPQHHRDHDPRLAEVRPDHPRPDPPHPGERVRRRREGHRRFEMAYLSQGHPAERDDAGRRPGHARGRARRPVRRDAELHRARRGGTRRMGQPRE